MTPQEELELYAEAKTAVRYFMEHNLWRHYIAYENHIVNQLTEEAAQGNLAHPNFAIQKAYLQGRVDAMKMLQNGRKALLKQGDTNDRPQSVQPSPKPRNFQPRPTKRTNTIGRFDDFKI